jgi:hypothetical protein
VGLPTFRRSQFPFWDFVQCNRLTVYPSEGYEWNGSLNSLSGISPNATRGVAGERGVQKHSLSIPFLGFRPMQQVRVTREIDFKEICSQFPFWDFVQCNLKNL